MRRTISIFWMLGALVLAPGAWAADLALIIANGVYQNHPFFQNTGAILNLTRPLQNAGFEVVVMRNVDSQTIEEDMPAISRRLLQADRIIVVASGYTARTTRDSWLLAADAEQPDSFSIGRYGISLGGLLDIAARKQGQALIAFAEVENDIKLGFKVGKGIALSDIPQGVTVVTGTPQQVAGFITDGVLVPGRSLAEAVKSMPEGFIARGFIPVSDAFLPATKPVTSGNLIERSFWQRTLSLNSLAAYEAYIQRYPNGIYSSDARQRIDALSLTPQDRARMAEEALNLSRSQRRAVQNNLTLLGFDTRGVDGVFGARSRSAVADWQRQIGAPVTGYLTANQVSRLETDGARRAEELRREAEQRKREEERKDKMYWAQTGANGSEAGLRAYLNRYPDGLYADAAQEQLEMIEREKRRLAEADERAAWDLARTAGTLQAYNAYLRDYPNGRFVEEARARVASLSNPETPPEVIEAAKAEEDSLNLNTFRRTLIERQLQAIGLSPGIVDGKFDRNTRRAIRQFQRASSLQPTGFVTRDTVVRLLVSSIDN